jgi:hypothetical protein
MKKLVLPMFVLLSLALAVSASIPNVTFLKQANGTWSFVHQIVVWQANPDAVKLDPHYGWKNSHIRFECNC